MKTIHLLGLVAALSLPISEQSESFIYTSPEADTYIPVNDDYYLKEKILKEVGFLNLLKSPQT